MARKLTGIISISGVDDEVFADEKGYNETPIQSFLDIDQQALHLGIQPLKWGGECRVEVDVTARAVGKGEIQVEGNAKLFEGTDENTGDLEDEKEVNFLVVRNTANVPDPTWHEIHLKSVGPGGGDSAKVCFSLSNYLVEYE